MRHFIYLTGRTALTILLAVAIYGGAIEQSLASDHLDTPSVIADPRADIGDLYAWTSPDGKRLNLVMTIVGHTFSDKLEYTFHVDSGAQFGKTTESISVACRFASATVADCKLGDLDDLHGDASSPGGLQSTYRQFRVFAGLRDDPFFNNVKGSRAAYNVAIAAMKNGASMDAAGCPGFDQETSKAILEQWRHTGGGPATNFLAGWTPDSIVVSVELVDVDKGGKFLAVWATTTSSTRQIDRAGRPLTGNALLGTTASDDVSDKFKEDYNAASPSTSAQFIPEVEKNLGLYDGFDGVCGNQLLVNPKVAGDARYEKLAKLLVDDRLWVDSRSTRCTQFFAVELANFAGQKQWKSHCGGRTPNVSAANIFRSLLTDGTTTSVNDGLFADEKKHSEMEFPFLAAPDAQPLARNKRNVDARARGR